MDQDNKAVEKKGRVWPWILVIIAIIALGAWGLTKYKKTTPASSAASVIAVVNGEEVTAAAFNARVEQAKANLAAQGVDLTQAGVTDQISTQVKEELINEVLVLQDAAKKGIAATDAEVTAQIDTIKKRFTTEDEFKAEISKAGLTEEAFSKNVRNQITIQKYIDAAVKGKDVKATTAEVNAFYEQVKAAQGTSTPKLAEVKAQIEAQIQQQKIAEIMRGVLSGLRSAGTIETK